jgi:hypothetical protein
MKNLINRTFTENQRDDVFGMAENEDGEICFGRLRKAFIEMLNQTGHRNDAKAYNWKDAMYQSISDSQDNYKRTGRY